MCSVAHFDLSTLCVCVYVQCTVCIHWCGPVYMDVGYAFHYIHLRLNVIRKRPEKNRPRLRYRAQCIYTLKGYSDKNENKPSFGNILYSRNRADFHIYLWPRRVCRAYSKRNLFFFPSPKNTNHWLYYVHITRSRKQMCILLWVIITITNNNNSKNKEQQ